MFFKRILEIVLVCRSGLVSVSEFELVSSLLAPARFQKDASEDRFESNQDETEWPTDAISATELQKYHDVPVSKHYFYEFKNEVTNETKYVTITAQGYLETNDGNLVSAEVLENSQVWSFVE
jgi:hypothetical protein